MVVFGKGVAYKKRVGDSINPAIIQKRFNLSSQTLNIDLQEILVSLSLEEISVVTRIVDYMRMHIAKKVSDSIYVSLSDHIHYALRNHALGISVKNDLMHDIVRFYSDEYAIGLKGLEMIEEETGVRLPIDEAGFIALHVVNAETDDFGKHKVERSTRIIEEVLDIVTDYFDKEIEEDSLPYFRFIGHLRYFANRVVSGSVFEDDQKDRELLDMVKKTYNDSYQCASNIMRYIRAKYEVDIGAQELAYLVIHIQRTMFAGKE